MPRNGSPPPLYFSGVHLENWRNFVRADVSLQKRIFLVGPNASGKSNFLDVFRFLHDLVSVGGGFQEAVERRGGTSSIRALAGRSPSDVVIQVEARSEEASEAAWRYELSLPKTAVENRSSSVRRPTGSETKSFLRDRIVMM